MKILSNIFLAAILLGFGMSSCDETEPRVFTGEFITFDGAQEFNLTESSGEHTITAVISKAPASDITIELVVESGGTAIEGDDFSFGSKSITIPAGAYTASTTFTLIDNVVQNENKTFDVSIVADGVALGAEATKTVNILDDDCPDVAINIWWAGGSVSIAETNSAYGPSSYTTPVSGDCEVLILGPGGFYGFSSLFTVDGITFTPDSEGATFGTAELADQALRPDLPQIRISGTGTYDESTEEIFLNFTVVGGGLIADATGTFTITPVD